MSRRNDFYPQSEFCLEWANHTLIAPVHEQEKVKAKRGVNPMSPWRTARYQNTVVKKNDGAKHCFIFILHLGGAKKFLVTWLSGSSVGTCGHAPPISLHFFPLRTKANRGLFCWRRRKAFTSSFLLLLWRSLGMKSFLRWRLLVMPKDFFDF